jgi:hypothetical protein
LPSSGSLAKLAEWYWPEKEFELGELPDLFH